MGKPGLYMGGGMEKVEACDDPPYDCPEADRTGDCIIPIMGEERGNCIGDTMGELCWDLRFGERPGDTRLLMLTMKLATSCASFSCS